MKFGNRVSALKYSIHIKVSQSYSIKRNGENGQKSKSRVTGSNEKLNSTCTLKNGLYDDFEE